MIIRIAIMGCGSLGTILGAYLNKGGLDVMMVDVYEEHVKALNEKGAQVVQGVEMTVPVKAYTPDHTSHPIIFIIVGLICLVIGVIGLFKKYILRTGSYSEY